MKIESTNLNGAYYIEPKLHLDKRGFFFEWFNQEKFHKETGIHFVPVQFNYSKSSRGVLRGMHFQLNPKAQSKLIAVTKGEIQDVIVDVRKGSPTFGKHFSVILSAEKRNQLFIPKGFAHGFLVLSEEAEIFYSIDDFYSPENEGGVMYNDELVGIEWLLSADQITLSDKDLLYSPIEEITNNFKY